MYGQICWENLGQFTLHSQECLVETLPFYRLSFAPGGRLLPFRLRQACRLLKDKKIRKVITPPDFPHWDTLKKQGFSPYQPLPSLQSLAGEILRHRLAQHRLDPALARVALLGERVNPQIYQVALELCPYVRELVIDFPQGGQGLQQRLLEEFGMAPSPPGRALTACLFFAPRDSVKSSISLQFYTIDSPDFCTIKLKNQGDSQGIPPLVLLALLLQTEKIQKNQIDFT